METQRTVTDTNGPGTCVSERIGDQIVVTPIGEFDLSNVDRLEQALMAGVQAMPQVRSIVVDFSQTTFIDSTCLRVFIAVHQQCVAGGGRLTSRGAQGLVARVLQITGLHDMIFE